MMQKDRHRYLPPPDPENPVHLAVYADDSAFRMVAGDIVEDARRLARKGKGK
jgi:hypothetical protein